MNQRVWGFLDKQIIAGNRNVAGASCVLSGLCVNGFYHEVTRCFYLLLAWVQFWLQDTRNGLWEADQEHVACCPFLRWLRHNLMRSDVRAEFQTNNSGTW